jgi:alkaline phosphatase
LLDDFLKRYPKNFYTSKGKFHEIYQPTYKNDGSKKMPKNVIVLISDGGAGQGQMWAAATANGGKLNLMQMKNIGLLKTNPTNDYTTDSAGAGTALATGQKTRNRRIGTDSLGNKIQNITEALAAKGVQTGIISNDGITGATPSAYYAHQPERDMGQEIAEDLLTSPADLVIAAPVEAFAANDSLLTKQLREKNIAVCNQLPQLSQVPLNQRVICLQGDDYGKNFRVIEESFNTVITRLSAGKKGFFTMIEGAKVDKGGHANDLYTVVDEYLSFDRLVGKALEYADQNGETLILVLSDHETGGLTLLDGDYKTGTVTGNFFTNDHTGIPTLLYAYGPCSQYFCGFAENSSLFDKILGFYK